MKINQKLWNLLALADNSSFFSIYYTVRPLISLKLLRFMHRAWAKNIDGFFSYPMWPLPEVPEAGNRVEWPERKESAFLITHDVDTRFGFENIRVVCEVEKRLGFKGSWNIVPNLYRIDPPVMDYLRCSGMEIGVHDWNHDGKLFLKVKTFKERIRYINRTIREWGARGFRAGAVFHNDEWMQKLECEYDSSYYDTDPFQPLGGGCATIWPFFLGSLVELPYTMPQDHVLFVARMKLRVPVNKTFWLDSKERKKNWLWMKEWCEKNAVEHNGKYWIIRGVDIWKMKAEWLIEKGGMILMLLHPEYLCQLEIREKNKKDREKAFLKRGWLPEDDEDVVMVRNEGVVEEIFQGTLLEQYAAFLHWFRQRYRKRVWHSLPGEVACFYKRQTVFKPLNQQLQLFRPSSE